MGGETAVIKKYQGVARENATLVNEHDPGRGFDLRGNVAKKRTLIVS